MINLALEVRSLGNNWTESVGTSGGRAYLATATPAFRAGACLSRVLNVSSMKFAPFLHKLSRNRSFRKHLHFTRKVCNFANRA